MKPYKAIVGALLKFEKIHNFLSSDCIVAFSGGLDSRVLFDVITKFKRDNNIYSRTIACHIPVYAEGVSGLNLDEVYEGNISEDVNFPISCSFCSRIRKRALLEFAKEKGIYNILLGHNKNDFVENFLYNQIYHKRLESMPLKRVYFEKYNFLRPFAFCSRKNIEIYAKENNLVDIENKCSASSRLRKEFREIIDKINKDYNLYNNVMDLIEKNKFYGEVNE
ncbi:hypothetical protein DSN97_08495 [Deferribacteraceae bacterium V6Fe1]|nr:hypothetical protein DSN97_08495 [Deferribacteraceae bacterium V6Fe1]